MCAILAAILLAGCNVAAGEPSPRGWAPLGRSDFPTGGAPQTWRDAGLGGSGSPFGAPVEAAVDAAGRVVVASVDRSLVVRVWRESANPERPWKLLPELRLADPEADGSWPAFALTTNEADEPLVAWRYGTYPPTPRRIGWARYTKRGWEVHEVSALPSDDYARLGIVAGPRDVRLYAHVRDWLRGDDVVYDLTVERQGKKHVAGAWTGHAIPQTDLVVTPSVAGRLAWVALDGARHVAWSGPTRIAGPGADVLARDVDEGAGTDARGEPVLVDGPTGWRWIATPNVGFKVVGAASSDGDPVLVAGYSHLVGTHYGSEVNRLATWRRVGDVWEPLSPAPLRTALLDEMGAQVRLLPTPAPTLVLGTAPLSVLRWNGHDWWGLGGAPEPAGDLGDPSLAASRVHFVGEELRWRERTEAGDVLRRARWNGRAWTSKATLQLPGSAWLWGQDSGRTHVLLRILGGWDRVHGLMGEVPEAAFFRWVGEAREDIPLPVPTASEVACGEAACLPASILERPDGSVLAVVVPEIPGIHLGSTRPPDPPGEIQRYVVEGGVGRWHTEAVTEARAWQDPTLQGGDPASAWFEDHVLIEAGGAWLPAPAPVKFQMVEALGIGGGHLLAVGLEKASERDETGTLRLVEYDGAVWTEHEGLPTDPAESATLEQGPDGVVWLAATLAGEIRLFQRTSAGWGGLGGSDGPRGVSSSAAPSYGPTIGFVDGRVCVAWLEAADQEPTVNVRCHVKPG